MYKLVIVDDEEIEREGMANFISWRDYGIELAGTAWNGLEAYDLIRRTRPDIVLTDMKMPIMDGIGLIRKTRQIFPDIEFIVLSGYGEYEYTSQAMEEGVQYYILKPCDEEKIVEVIGKVKGKLDDRLMKNRKQMEYDMKVYRMQVLAGQQTFRNILLGREHPGREIWQDTGHEEDSVRVFSIRMEGGFDDLEQFVAVNMMHDLLPAGILLRDTSIQDDVLLLVRDCSFSNYEWAADRLYQESQKFSRPPLRMAVSFSGVPEEIPHQYEETQYLLSIQDENTENILLCRERFGDGITSIEQVFDYSRLKAAKNYEELLFEITLAFFCMGMRHCDLNDMYQNSRIALALTLGIQMSAPEIRTEEFLLAAVMEAVSSAGFCQKDGGETDKRMLRICFQEIGNPQVSVGYLARDVLFISEGYFSRLFTKCTGKKFSAWLQDIRIRMAKRLIEYAPDRKVGEIGAMVGFSPDGQYFSKLFRNVMGESPSDYRERCLKKSTQNI